MKRTHTRAFSLVEVLIAIVVFIVGISGVTSALWFGVKSSQHGTRITEATNHGRSMMEALIGRNYIDNAAALAGTPPWPTDGSGINDNDPNTRRPLDEAPFLATHLPASDIRSYTRNVTCERITNDDTSHEYHLARVTISIFWEENGSERKVEISSVVPHAL